MLLNDVEISNQEGRVCESLGCSASAMAWHTRNNHSNSSPAHPCSNWRDRVFKLSIYGPVDNVEMLKIPKMNFGGLLRNLELVITKLSASADVLATVRISSRSTRVTIPQFQSFLAGVAFLTQCQRGIMAKLLAVAKNADVEKNLVGRLYSILPKKTEKEGL